MARLPIPGSDSGDWGNILNDFLSQSLDSNGTIKSSAIVSKADTDTVLLKDNNLSDLSDTSAARSNLGLPYCPNILVSCQGYRSTVGTWGIITSTSMSPLVSTNTGGGALNDEFTLDWIGQAGTYTMRVPFLRYHNRGICTFYVDGTTVGSIDGYATGAVAAWEEFTGISVIGDGAHTIRVLVTGKNASSSSYVTTISNIGLLRTGS